MGELTARLAVIVLEPQRQAGAALDQQQLQRAGDKRVGTVRVDFRVGYRLAE
jgi:hypothetical protein